MRKTAMLVVGALLLGVAPAASSPVPGHRREPMPAQDGQQKKAVLYPDRSYTFTDTFRANERACIIVEGDHEPVMDLKITVTDQQKNVVAQDTAGGDFVSAIWYPPRQERYTITITGNGSVENYLYIVVK